MSVWTSVVERVARARGLVAAWFAVCAAPLVLATGLVPVLAVRPAQGPEGEQGPRQIGIGIYLLNLEQLNVSNGNYTAEALLTLTCPGTCDGVSYRVIDGKSTVLDTDTLQRGDSEQVTTHVRLELNENLTFNDFPFDRHTLNIRIESIDDSVEQLEFVADPELSGMDSTLGLAGWMVDPKFSAFVAPQTYPVFADEVSRFTYSFVIHRPPLYGWLKVLLPATIIMISGLLVYLFRYDMADKSIAVVTAALVGSVLFNVNLTSSLPATGHLTRADLFMVVNYVALSVTLAVMIAVYVLSETKREARAQRLFRIARYAVPLCWLVAQATLIGWTLLSVDTA